LCALVLSVPDGLVDGLSKVPLGSREAAPAGHSARSNRPILDKPTATLNLVSVRFLLEANGRLRVSSASLRNGGIRLRTSVVCPRRSVHS